MILSHKHTWVAATDAIGNAIAKCVGQNCTATLSMHKIVEMLNSQQQASTYAYISPLPPLDPVLTEPPKEILEPTQMRFIFMNHQQKGNCFSEALRAKGGTAIPYPLPRDYKSCSSDFVLTDSDASPGKVHRLSMLRDQTKIKTFIVYPHAARPPLYADLYPVFQHTTMQIVSAAEHVEILRIIGYDKPMVVVGWSLCPIREFRSTWLDYKKPLKVLFAPIHPHCASIDKDVNRKVYAILLKLHIQGGIELIVRYIKSMASSGLSEERIPKVIYSQGNMDGDYSQIDKVDIVVSHQTYAYMAVARGIPTVMMAEYMPTHSVKSDDNYVLAKQWDKYKDRLMYPLDILDCPDPLMLMHQACRDDSAIADWRERLIGEQFEPSILWGLIKEYIHHG